MAELTWVAKTHDDRIYHVSESKAKPGMDYEVWPSSLHGDYFIAVSDIYLFDGCDQYYPSAVEAKQACQSHENAMSRETIATTGGTGSA